MNKYEHFSQEARKRRREERMCSRKRGYLSRCEAEKGAADQEVYQCPYCDLWHRTGCVARLARRLEKQYQRKNG